MKNPVLVMDSDFLSNWFLTRNLNDMGYHVITVSDKDSLLKRLAVGSFHAVVVRVDQADAGADTAVQEVRSAHPGVRVIAYAPYAAKSLRDEFEKENIRYFIHPFRANEIRRAMT